MSGMKGFRVAKCPEAHSKTNRAVVNEKAGGTTSSLPTIVKLYHMVFRIQ